MPLYRHFADLAGNDKLMMPVPCFNVINGGSHAGNKLAFQEYFVIPTGAANFAEGMQIGTEVYHNLAKILKKKFGGDSTHLTYHDPSLHTTTHLHPQPILHTTTHLTYRNPSYIPQPISQPQPILTYHDPS